MARADIYTIGDTEQLQVSYADGEEVLNPVLEIVLLLSEKVGMKAPPLKVNGDTTGWGLLLELAALPADQLSLPLHGSEFTIGGTADVVNYHGVEYLQIL